MRLGGEARSQSAGLPSRLPQATGETDRGRGVVFNRNMSVLLTPHRSCVRADLSLGLLGSWVVKKKSLLWRALFHGFHLTAVVGVVLVVGGVLTRPRVVGVAERLLAVAWFLVSCCILRRKGSNGKRQQHSSTDISALLYSTACTCVDDDLVGLRSCALDYAPTPGCCWFRLALHIPQHQGQALARVLSPRRCWQNTHNTNNTAVGQDPQHSPLRAPS